MVAVIGNLEVAVEAGLEDHLPVFCGDAFAVYGDVGHRWGDDSGDCA